jgi:hypothetical protein
MPDLYFNRVPSLPATDDGSGRPLTEDLSTGSDDGEDIAWDADTAEAGEVAATAGAASGPRPAGAASGTRPAGAEPRDGEADAGPEMAGPDGEAEFTEADVAFLSAPQAANATVTANGTVTKDAPGPDAAPEIGESGRWFRPAKAKKNYVPIPPEDQDGSAGPDAAPAGPEPDGAVATQDPPEPDGAVATEDPPEPHAEPAGRVGSAAGRMSALLWPGGGALASPPEGPVLAPLPDGPVLAPLPEGPVLAPGGRRLSRRRMLQADLIAGAGVAALPLLALVSGSTWTDKQAPASPSR